MNIVEIINHSEVVPLLRESSLPTADLESSDKVVFYGCYDNEQLIACVGLELYPDVALLRSLAVHPDHQNRGIAKSLVQYAENICSSKQISEIYLLTNTAKGFFKNRGYQIYERENAPSAIKKTSQFSGVCPCSSTLMRKAIISS